MELSRQEYPALLRSLSPNQAVSVLDERVKLIGKVNADIADWLAERRRVEDAYVQGLRKLASRGPRDVSSELGIFRSPWQSILHSVDALAESHGVLAQRIEVDVERPLKEFQSRNREMQAISTVQGNLAALAKDVESAQKKVSKLQGGKSSANKVANASADVEAANQQWEYQAPYVYEQLQALDESRVNHLRDVLTQLETHETDRVERDRSSAEACLNTILNINTTDEISAFVARQTPNAPTIPERQASRNRAGSSTNATVPPSEQSTAAATPARRPPEDTSEASPFSTMSSRMGPPPSSRKGFGGFGRRLGTVLSRDKGSKGMDRPPSPEKRFRPGRNPLRRGQSSRQELQQLESPPQTSSSDVPPQATQLAYPLIETNNLSPTNRPSTPPPIQSNVAPSPGIVQHPPRESSMPLTNGVQTGRDVGPTEITQTASQSQQLSQTQRDAEGYNVAPTAVDDITRAQQEAAAAGDGDQSQLKLNIRDAPIHDEDEFAQQSAFSTVASTLRSQAIPKRQPTGNRGRRDVRNTVFIPEGQTIDNVALGGSSAFGGSLALGTSPAPNLSSQTIGTPPLPSDSNRGGDAQSIRSAHSMVSTTNPVISHPQMRQPGLNASVVETVSATFQQGQITKAVVIGEMALQHNPLDNATSPASESVRLENFPVLEKVAPNPVFISEKASASGEYRVNLSHPSRPTVAFKYQLHLEDTTLGCHAPISLTPTWKIEPTQASVILAYMLNPAFATSSPRSVFIKNLVIFISIEGAKANSCQSKPAGIFSKERSLIYWKLNDTTLKEGSHASQRLLARFSTEIEAKPGDVEAKWEISGEEAVGLGSGLGLSQLGGGKEGSGGSDPFADEDARRRSTESWKEVPLTRKLVSGKYIAA